MSGVTFACLPMESSSSPSPSNTELAPPLPESESQLSSLVYGLYRQTLYIQLFAIEAFRKYLWFVYTSELFFG